MRSKSVIVVGIGILAVVAGTLSLQAQQSGTVQPPAQRSGTVQPPAQPDPQAISKTGLLPLYGVDFRFDPSWVDDAQFPSQTATHPNSGVNASFQQVWEALKPGGYNLLRVELDIGDPVHAANRAANLCLWAKNNGVKLVISLSAGSDQKQLNKDLPEVVGPFIQAVIAALRGKGGQQLPAYSQITAYQVGYAANATGLHGGIPAGAAQQVVLKTGEALHKSEREALSGSGLDATPVMADFSFDYELVQVLSIAGTPLSDENYQAAYKGLRDFLAPLTASPDVNVVCIEWLAGSISAGGVDKFAGLLRSLATDFHGTQLLFSTGFSTAFRSPEEQKRFYGLAFANVADFRASMGVDCPVVGMIYREALNGKNANIPPPKPEIPAQMASWDWKARAVELKKMWSGGPESTEVAWWAKRIQNNMGLVQLETDANGNPVAASNPAEQTLTQVAGAVGQANAAQTASKSGSAGESLKSKVQQGLLGLLNDALQKLGNSISGSGAGLPGQSSGMTTPATVSGATGSYSQPPSASSSYSQTPSGAPANPPAVVMVSLTQQDVSITPGNAQVGQTSTISANLHNQGATVASGLTVFALGQDNSWLAQTDGVQLAPNMATPVSLQWTPYDAQSSYRITLKVTDSYASELASVSLDPITIAAAPASAGGSNASSGTGGETGGTGAPVFQPSGSSASGSGTSTSGDNAGAGASVLPLTIVPPKLILPIGGPRISNLQVGTLPRIQAKKPALVSLSLSNPFQVPLQALSANLMIDNQLVQTLSIDQLLPQQTRSLVFPGVIFPQTGQHEVKIVLQSRRPGAKPKMGVLSTSVTVSPQLPEPTVPRLSAGAKAGGTAGALSKASGTSSATTTRSLLPPMYNVGGLTVPSTIGEVAPSFQRATASTIAAAPSIAPKPAVQIRPIPATPTTSSTPSVPAGSTATLQPATRPIVPSAPMTATQPTVTATPATPVTKLAPVIPAAPAATKAPALTSRCDIAVAASDITYTPNPPRNGQPLTFTVGVRNRGGDAQAVSVVFKLSASGRLVASWQAPPFSMAANAVRTLNWTTAAPVAGPFQLSVVATANQDTNVTNNQASVTGMIVAPVAPRTLSTPAR